MMFADAVVAAQPAASVVSQILAVVFSQQTLGLVVGGALGLLGLWVKSENRRRQVAKAVSHAFHIVEDIADEDAHKSVPLNKAEEGLKAADAWMVANGWRALKPGEQEVAKLGFKAINGATILAEKSVP